jgi:hypothetical protein
MPPPFPWLRVYALRVLIALSIQRGLRAMRSDFLLAFFRRVQFPLLVSPYSLSYRGSLVCYWCALFAGNGINLNHGQNIANNYLRISETFFIKYY